MHTHTDRRYETTSEGKRHLKKREWRSILLSTVVVLKSVYWYVVYLLIYPAHWPKRWGLIPIPWVWAAFSDSLLKTGYGRSKEKLLLRLDHENSMASISGVLSAALSLIPLLRESHIGRSPREDPKSKELKSPAGSNVSESGTSSPGQ